MQTAILVASFLLFIGFFLRARLRILQAAFIPASIAGGLVGLGLIQAVLAWGQSDQASDSAFAWLTTDVVGELRTWPGWLIAVVFAGLLMEGPSQGIRASFHRAGREGIVVWIIAVGQTAVGVGVTWLLLMPLYDVPATFGVLIETGFAGGHGTAAAMGEILEEKVSPGNRLPADFGQFMATLGLLISVVTGIGYINLGVRRKWTHARELHVTRISGMERRRDPQPLGWARINSEVLDPLVFQMLFLAAAFILGLAMSGAVAETVAWLRLRWVASGADAESLGLALLARVGDFPLFIYTLLGGLGVRKTMEWLGLADLIDAESIRRLSSTAMEFLVVAAIASLNIQAVSATLTPLLILVVAAIAWTAVCLLVIGRLLLPREYWLELGLINYGMSTGTTATGLVLLRVVDEKFETAAAEDYAIAAPLSSPFVGGGLLTLSMPLFLDRVPIGVMAVTLAAIVAALFVMGWLWARLAP